MTYDYAPLDLASLARFDPNARGGGAERRYLCPFCGGEKRPDTRHRSLVVNVASGAWLCHRCARSGQLRDYWSGAAIHLARGLQRPQWQPAPEPPPPVTVYPLDKGAIAYLRRRGLGRELAERNDVVVYVDRFEQRWLAFPLRDAIGANVALQCRRIGNGKLLHYAHGPKGAGLFAARPLEAPWSAVNVVVEAPLDALSVAAAGLTALATAGISYPSWLPRVLAGRRTKTVLLGHDADAATAAGDLAAQDLAAALERLGAQPIRARPIGAKDWNDLLRLRLDGAAEIRRQLAALLEGVVLA